MASIGWRDEKNKAENGTYVVFYIDDCLYGIDVMKVKEIIKLDDILAVTDSPDCVTGVIFYNGESVPVVDMRLKKNPRENIAVIRDVILIVDVNGKHIGMAADVVAEIMKVESGKSPFYYEKSGNCVEEKLLKLFSEDDEEVVFIDDEELIM